MIISKSITEKIPLVECGGNIYLTITKDKDLLLKCSKSVKCKCLINCLYDIINDYKKMEKLDRLVKILKNHICHTDPKDKECKSCIDNAGRMIEKLLSEQNKIS